MSLSPREMLQHVVHTHFESLVASWLHGQHDPAREMLIVRTEETATSYNYHGEFWPVKDLDESLKNLQDHTGILRHNLFMQGLERELPMLILSPGTVLPLPSSLACPSASSRAVAEFGDEL
jgi:hypothetical protein